MSNQTDQNSKNGAATPPAPGQQALEVQGISAGYGDIVAVWDVSLAVGPGEAVVLVGRNGAGKTTTLSAIGGLLRARKGSITVNAKPVTTWDPYQRVQAGLWYVQEGHQLFGGLTVEQNLVVALRGSGLKRGETRAKIREIYELFPFLRSRRGDRAGSLSGGQQQLLILAEAIGVAPRVLLLDEPSGGLAPQAMQECANWIAELQARGTALVIVEQRPELVVEMCREIVTIDNGRVIRREALASNPRLRVITSDRPAP
jgi:branched-chain amino acid transport system ATP-binding protein